MGISSGLWFAFLVSLVFSAGTAAADCSTDFVFKFEHGSDLKPAVCDSPPMQKVIAALTALRDMPTLEPASSDLRGDFLKGSPYAFFSARVHQIWFNTDPESSACKASGILAYVSDKNSRTIHLCPFSEKLTAIGLQSILLHEAHHLVGPDLTEVSDQVAVHPHARCLRGPAKGLDACDEEYSAGGSYALQTEFLLRVARTPSLPTTTRDEARAMALTYILDHFNHLPFALDEGLLLQTQTGDISFFSSAENSLIPVMTGVPSDHLVSVRGVPVVLNPLDGRVESYAGPDSFVKTPGSFAEFYRQQTENERRKTLDIYFGGSQACILYPTAVYCEVGPYAGKLILPTGFQPVHFNVISLYGDDMVFVVNAAGDLYLLPFNVPLEEWSTDKLEKNSTLHSFLSVAMLPNANNFALNLDGQLMSFHGGKRQSVSGLEAIRFSKILGAYRWSSRLNNL